MAGAGFIRRFTTDPGIATTLAIEGIVIIDRDPVSSVQGEGTGFVTCVGEFEDGEYNVPLRHSTGDDLARDRGGFGFVYEGLVSCNPCARQRSADGALNLEYWNGNGFVALVNKKFAELASVRVDTSVGAVTFTRIPSVLGNNNPFWDLETGQTLSVDPGSGPLVATFTGVAALMTSAPGAYPPAPSIAGKSVTLVIDLGSTGQIGPVAVYFQLTDTTQAAVVSRINSFLGYTGAVVAGGGVTTIVGRVKGTAGHVQVTAIHADVATATGLSVSVANGTGNVASIDAVTFAEAKSIIEAAVAGTRVERNETGQIRIDSTSGAFVVVGNVSTALAFGFPLGTTFTNVGIDSTIPAGTRVRDVALNEWVTAITTAVKATVAGPYTIKIRPALDNGTSVAVLAGAVNAVPFPIPEAGAFTVLNALPIGAALTEAAIDAAYVAAMLTTLNSNLDTAKTDIIVSARQSNAVRNALRNNALDASTESLSGRVAVIRPPLGTTRAIALGNSQPGVSVYRSQNVGYAFPGAATFVPQIAVRGLSGGAGFTADGIISTGFDMWAASIMSQLLPEEDPGQLTPYANLIVGFELNNPDVADMKLADYINFKAAGIMALRFAEGSPIIQSGVTSVLPSLQEALAPMNRRRFSYFIEDSLAAGLSQYSKKLATRARRAEVYSVVQAFLAELKSVGNDAAQRIEDFSIDAKSPNTPQSLARGIFRMQIKVRMIATLLDIVLDVTTGAGVTVDVVL